MDEAEHAREPGGAEDEATAATTAPRAVPRRPRLSRFGVAGIVFVLIGGLGLWSDYNLDWFSTTAERERPFFGVINEGAPWVDHDRASLERAYAESTLYSLGYLIWTWGAWIASIAAGLGLLVSDALGRWPRGQARLRTVLVTGHILAAGMMLLTVSRRVGKQVLDLHYNEIDYYVWKETIWVQGIGAVILVAASGLLLWHLRRTHPPVSAAGIRKPHHGAFTLCVGTILLVAAAMLVSPWVPLAEFRLPAIVGSQWWGEGVMSNLAKNGTGHQGLAGQGYVGAARALFVAAGTALVSAFGVVGWERAESATRARIWGLVAQVHLIAIVPLYLGFTGYGIYVRSMHRIDRIHLGSNQFVGLAIDILLVTWIIHVMWILLPYVKRWLRPSRPASADATIRNEMGPDGGGHASVVEAP